jgi:hypothetical protein
MEERPDITGLASATRQLLRDAGGGLAAGFLRDWPTDGRWRATAPRPLPVLKWLGPACRAGSPNAASLLKAMEAASPRLTWRQT